ncbi:hypothetical protein [Amycolatopsis sp.]|uniref:hypothetical protein n=1 Tax=Amycolatopsis sp. TaxID=37632 RepID=UPI002B7A74B5|nr:hypothetical protein [Amycolatopsis sp.]HVV08474.1 hypothetical protein [Amycolatopsis sp.]
MSLAIWPELFDTEGTDPVAASPDFPELCRLLFSAASDEDTIARIAARSSAHPNGFLKVVVVPGLRVHTWFTTAESADADAHDHRWPYASLTLTGALREREYRLSTPDDPAARPVTALRYRSDHEKGTFSFSTGIPAWLRQGEARVLRPGAMAAEPATRIHRVRAEVPMTSTLVHTGPPRAAASTVYRAGSAPVDPGRAERPDTATVRNCLLRSTAALNALMG